MRAEIMPVQYALTCIKARADTIPLAAFILQW
jgi:hypothetical protein